MNEPTVHILYDLIDGPWGGANQFLRALKDEFCRMQVYREDPRKADILLFNSNPANYETKLTECFQLRKWHRKTVINRVGGPIFVARGGDLLMDKAICIFNASFCDGTIFQSARSMRENMRLGMKAKVRTAVIPNAPDPNIFKPAQTHEKEKGGKVRLIATSWSANMRKGFDILKFLDENLDFSRYEMSFYGNSRISFRNIMSFPPISSKELADTIRTKNIFIATSKYEACSNSLLEALHCGIPAVARAGGADMDILGGGGIIFNDEGDVIQAIERVAENIESYSHNIKLAGLAEIAERYYEFCKRTHELIPEKKKRASRLSLLRIDVLMRIRKALR